MQLNTPINGTFFTKHEAHKLRFTVHLPKHGVKDNEVEYENKKQVVQHSLDGDNEYGYMAK